MCRVIDLVVHVERTADGARRVTVIPIASDQALRSRAWVEHNRRVVDSLSKGQLAYVYLPNTGQPGYTYFNRYYFAQQDRKGAIIDERYNGGGQAADYIIDVLQRDFDGYFNNVAGDRTPFTSPAAGIWGPKVMIINEMAGSGGDLMPWMFHYRKIGTLVGKRTWGGLVHTADTPGFVVEREEQIRKFISRDYWEIHASFLVEAGEYAGKWFNPGHKKDENDAEKKADRVWSQAEAQAIADDLGVKLSEVLEMEQRMTGRGPRWRHRPVVAPQRVVAHRTGIEDGVPPQARRPRRRAVSSGEPCGEPCDTVAVRPNPPCGPSPIGYSRA